MTPPTSPRQHRRNRPRWPPPVDNRPGVARLLLAAPVFFVLTWCFMWLRYAEQGSALLFIYAFSVVWLADIGAYFVGKRCGARKLAPLFSPGKTREGALGGLLAVVLWSVGFAAMGWLPFSALALLAASLAAGVFSMVGDLFESAMKRAAGVKDSGAVLPGHGGVLDRVDSIIAAVPVFVFLLVLIESLWR